MKAARTHDKMTIILNQVEQIHGKHIFLGKRIVAGKNREEHFREHIMTKEEFSCLKLVSY